MTGTTSRTTARGAHVHRGLAATLGCLLAAVLGLTLMAAPSAATESGQPTGWVRAAHLSPDTKAVDVQLTAAAGGQVLLDVPDVAYGDVSDYVRLPVGTYVISMAPVDSDADAEPAISQSVAVEENAPITIAALGTNADLYTTVFQDDLTAPEDGEARVRVLQASTVEESVDINTTSGLTIAEGARSGEVTGYATVDAGSWDLELTADGVSSAAEADLPSGSVNTLLVLDNASGGLTIKALTDSEAVESTPEGGVDTGATPASTGSAMFFAAGLGAMALLTALVGTHRYFARRPKLGVRRL